MNLFDAGTAKTIRRSILSCFLILATVEGFSSLALATTIGNGETVSGSVTGSGVEDWTFYAPANFYANIVGGMGVPVPDSQFKPGLKVYYPSGGGVAFLNNGFPGDSGSPSAWGPPFYAGTYTIEGYNLLGGGYPSFVANFNMNISVSNLSSRTPASGGGAMNAGVTYNATQSYGDTTIWTFNANVGDNISVVATPGTGYVGRIRSYVFQPNGWVIASGYSSSNTTPATASFTNAPQAGEYVVQTFNGTTISASAPYTVEMTGSTAMSFDAKADGKKCIACQGGLAAQSGTVTSTGGDATK